MHTNFSIRNVDTPSVSLNPQSLLVLIDQDGDYILVSSDEELTLALSNSKDELFRVFVLLFPSCGPNATSLQENAKDVGFRVCLCVSPILCCMHRSMSMAPIPIGGGISTALFG